jgi:hypothetical protein
VKKPISKKAQAAIYTVAALFFLFLIFGNELFWRYESNLNITIRAKIRDKNKSEKIIAIEEESDSPVDTSRREFKDIKRGITDVYIWIDNGTNFPDSSKQQIIKLSLSGKYFTEARPVHLSNDSSTQLLLIPNTIQGMETGANKMIYLKSDSTFALKEFSGFIADVDKDGSEEVNIPDKGWMKFDPISGELIQALLKK